MQDLPNPAQKLLPIGKASKHFGVSIDTIRRWDKSGKIKIIRTPGGTRLIPLSEIERVQRKETHCSLPIGKAAEELGVSIQTLRRWDKQGLVESTRTAKGTRQFTPESLTKVKTEKPKRVVPLPVAIEQVEVPKLTPPQPKGEPTPALIKPDLATYKLHQKVAHHIKNTRPSWYHKYHELDWSQTLHYGILAAYLVLIGAFILYSVVIRPGIDDTKNDLSNQLAGLGDILAATSPPSVLSFQGRLTNTSDVPVTGSTDIVFNIYSVRTGGSAIWTSKTWTVDPDQNGIFSVCLGNQTTTDDCINGLVPGDQDNTFPATLFTDNAALYLEVQVAGETLSPRQRISSVSYALNSDALDGVDSLLFLRSDEADVYTSGILTTNAGTTLDVNGILAWGDAIVSETLAMNSNNITGVGTNITAAAGLTLTTTTSSALTLDSGTTGAINIGNNANAKTITIGNVTGATTLDINTGTGGVTIDSTGTGDIVINSTDTLLLDSTGVLELNSSAGVISIGNDAVAQNINIGTGAAARTITIGNLTGATQVDIDSGTGGINLEAAGTGTTDVIQIGAGGAGSGTPDFFALDVKSTATDPAGGAEGYMYYSNDTNKFRCYEGAAWTDCIGAAGASTLQQAYVAGNTIGVTSGEGALGIDLTSANLDIEVGEGTDTGDFRIWDGTTNWMFIDEGSDTLALGTAAGSGITLGGSGITTTNSGALTVTEIFTANGDITANDAGADNILIGAAADTVTIISNTLSLTDDNWSISAAGTGTFANLILSSGTLTDNDSAVTIDDDLTITTGTTISAASITTLNCTDCINFDDLSDSLSVDAATTVALGGNNLTINLDSTGEFAIQDGGGDVLRVADDTGTTTISDDVDLSFAGAENLSISNTSASADAISLTATGITTDGIDGLQLTFGISNASGNAIGITPTFGDTDAGNDAETWNVIDIDNFSVNQNDTGGAVTGIVNGVNIGDLSETETGDDVITSSAINIGDGWDTVLAVNDTTPVHFIDIDYDGTVNDAFNLKADNIVDGDVFKVANYSPDSDAADVIDGIHQATYIADLNIDGNILDLDRDLTADDSTGGTITLIVDTPLAVFTDNCAVGTADACTHTGNVLQLDQQYASAYGAVLDILNSGFGADISLANGETIDNGTDNTIILASNAASGAGVLRLPVKTDTGNPSLNVEGNMYYNTADNKFRCYENTAWTDCIGSGGSPTLDAVLAATGAATRDHNANTITWQWDFTGADTGLTLGEASASTGGSGNQFLVDLSTATGSTASPFRVTSDSVDAADITFNLANAGDLEIQDAGTAFALFEGDGSITLGKSASASTINIGSSANDHTIAIGNVSATTVSITDDNWSISAAGLITLTDATLSRDATNQITLGTGDWLRAPVDASNYAVFGQTYNGSPGAFIGIVRGASTNDTFYTMVSGESNPRFIMDADGNMRWGSGSSGTDVSLYRLTTNTLALGTSNAFITSGDVTFEFGGTENLELTSNLDGTVNVASIIGTPSATDYTTRGLFIQQADSANSYGLDSAVVVDNADANLAITTGIDFTDTGGGGFTTDISLQNGETIDNATDNTIILSSDAASGAGVLRLPVKTDTGNPSLDVEGNMYYNTADNKFRCYENTGWTDCIGAGGAFSGEVDDTTNNALTFTNDDASPPAGSVNSIFRDNSGDLNINVIDTKTINLQENGNDEYNFSDTTLDFNANTITNVGNITATAAITIASTGGGNDVIIDGADILDVQDNAVFTGTITGNGVTTFNTDVDLTLAAAENLNISNTTATADVLSLTATSAQNDGINVAFTLGDDGDNDTLSAIDVNVTSAVTGDSDTLYGMNIASLTSPQAGVTEYALNIGSGWDDGLVIADATTYSILLSSTDGDVASGITFGSATPVSIWRSAAGELTIGDGSGNNFVFDTVNGPDYAGTARPTKTITLSPEYAGAVLTDYYGAGTDAVITGSMTSDTDTTQGTTIRNYYEWNSSETAAQNFYTVAVRITLPKDFSAWATSNALVVNYITNSATTTQSDLDVRVYNENSATIVASDLDNSSVTWTTAVIDDSTLDDGASSEWDAADEVAVIYLRMGSQDDDNVRVGDIRLNYLAKF